MAVTIGGDSIRRLGRFGAERGLFIILVYLYVWWVVDPRLIHHSLGVLTYYAPFSFHSGWSFLAEHLSRPGGLVEYAARLLTQCYALGWLGAVIITGAACYTSLAADGLCRRAGRPRGSALRDVPTAVLLVMYGGYSHPLNALLSLLVALLAYGLFVRAAPRAVTRRPVWLVIAGAAAYWLAGAGSLLFPVLVAVDELLLGGSKRFAAGALVVGLAMPGVAVVFSDVSVQAAYAGFLLADPGVGPGKWSYTLALYLFFPTLLAGTVRWEAAQARGASAGRSQPNGVGSRFRAKGQRQGKSLPENDSRPLRRWAARGETATTAGSYAAVAVVAWFSLAPLTRSILEIDYHAQQEEWAETVQAGERLPAGVYNVRCHRNLMLALYHTGRLGDEMFAYFQKSSPDLYFTPVEHRDVGSHYQESRLFLELGEVNQAERSAYEAFAGLGAHPAVLRQLATINAVKGRVETARMFWKALAQNPFQRRTARKMLERLETDPALDAEPQVRQLRENMLDQDRVTATTGVEESLQALLARNPRNRLAFELLMAEYLTTRRPDSLAANLKRHAAWVSDPSSVQNPPRPRLPRHYQEALILHAEATGRPLTKLTECDSHVLARYREFRRICETAPDPQAAGTAALAAGLSDTYFFYFTFGVSGR